jgi:hypothetical protein
VSVEVLTDALGELTAELGSEGRDALIARQSVDEALE